MAVESSAPFYQFATLCEKISKTAIREKKTGYLKNFLDLWHKHYEQSYPTNPQPPIETFFPFMRLLLPEADRDRPVYGIKETVLARLFIQELGLSKGSEASETLLHWKKHKPQGVDYREVADFAGVAYHVLQNRIRKDDNEAGMSIRDINKFLDTLAEANLVGGDERKEQTNQAFRETWRRMDVLEWKWLIRIILKDLKLGIGEDAILNLYHPDAKDLYDVTSSLSGVCFKLLDPKVRLSEIEISLFMPVKPMLAETWSPAKLRVILKGNALLAEIKYDGDRCQIHKSNDQFKYFSRAGNENTEILGGGASEGNLTKYIADCFNPEADSFIIDGEICAFDMKEKCIATKAESYSIKTLNGENGYQVCFVAFDCLFYNGKTVTGLPLTERLAILKDLFQVEEGRLYYATRKKVTTPEECYEYLNEAIDRNEEGIILKQPSSVYKPNSRSAGWWKVKPEFVDSLSDQLDVLVVGGYYGTGRRTGFSHFLLAVAQNPDKAGDYPNKFLSFCRVGSGYTYKELQEMGLKLAPHLKPWNSSAKPAWLTLMGEKEKPDAYIEPDKSFIVKVSAAQLLDSDAFATGCTLRFPRLKECRTDKHWYECMTLSQLLELKGQSSGRLGAKHVTDDHFGMGASPKKRLKAPVHRTAVLRLAEHFRPADVSGVKTQGHIFAGKEFYVAGGDKAHSKQDLEKLIVAHGGSVVQKVTEGNTFCVISDKRTVHVQNIIKTHLYDVVYPAWILRCVTAKEISPWHPNDLMFAQERTQKLIKNAFDKYGDSFTEDITLPDLERIFTDMETKDISRTQLTDFEDRYYNNFPSFALFRTCTAYFDKYAVIGEPASGLKPGANMALAEVEFLAGGGLVMDKISSDVTHIVLHSHRLARLEAFRKLNRSRLRKFHIVSEKWVLDSVEQKMTLDERGFVVRSDAQQGSSLLCLLSTAFEVT
ncbi:hypothetical protein RvY_18881 [Ramazzottius varieornatus]|uniref:DNA ligase n=1 Tax=Ramazzottius varieornatus TaxID=947166 RepID=A0A1D1W7D7_RAMVA|nr:hypothetical protein RvY_18881 [Ramazzottius varieornatus]